MKADRQIRETILKHNLISEGDHIVMGLSGGPDSMCLFNVLLNMADEKNLTIHPVHVNHKFRPGAAEADQTFVEDACRKAGLECRSFVVDCNALALELGMTGEEAGRKARYDAFFQVAREIEEMLIRESEGKEGTMVPADSELYIDNKAEQNTALYCMGAEGFNNKLEKNKAKQSNVSSRYSEKYTKKDSVGKRIKIAVAQNANDQAETILFRLLRGTGTDGLAGIAYAREESRIIKGESLTVGETETNSREAVYITTNSPSHRCVTAVYNAAKNPGNAGTAAVCIEEGTANRPATATEDPNSTEAAAAHNAANCPERTAMIAVYNADDDLDNTETTALYTGEEATVVHAAKNPGNAGTAAVCIEEGMANRLPILEGNNAYLKKTYTVIRPLLDTWRRDIEAYCEEQNLHPVIDHTNNEELYARNKIRLDLIPYIKGKYNENIEAGLNRLGRIASADKDYFWKETNRVFEELQKDPGCDERYMDSGCIEPRKDPGCDERYMNSGCIESRIDPGCDERMDSGCIEPRKDPSCDERYMDSGCIEPRKDPSCDERYMNSGCIEPRKDPSCDERYMNSGCIDRTAKKMVDKIRTDKTAAGILRENTENIQAEVFCSSQTVLDREGLAACHEAIRHRVVQRAFEEIGLVKDITAERLDSADAIICKKQGEKIVEFPHGYRIRVAKGRVHFEKEF